MSAAPDRAPTPAAGGPRVDAHGADLALRATGLLRDANRAGLITAADVHVAQRLCALAEEQDEAVRLAVALVVRSTRQGSVVLDLASARETTSADADAEPEEDPVAGVLASAPAADAADVAWPGPDWASRVAASPLAGGPLRVEGTRVWLGRYWDQEALVARELAARAADVPDDVDPAVLRGSLERLFGPGDEDQREAAACCALSRVSVLAGGPGTGKTTTVARVVAVLKEQHPQWRVALAAPTGRAAARLAEAVAASTARLPEEDRARLGELPATTLHRLLGWKPGSRSRFRHDRHDRLALEVVVVDESSMVSLTLMARLLEALRPSTRLVLVGDPDQLASVEAGAVLGDVVDREHLGARSPRLSAALAAVLPAGDAGAAAGSTGTAPEPGAGERPVTVRDGVSVLTTPRRFRSGGAVDRLAAAVRDGRGEEALAVLRSGEDGVELLEVAEDLVPEALLQDVRGDVVGSAVDLDAAARRGDAAGALEALDRHRLLTAHRSGPRGLRRWTELAERWTSEATGAGRARRPDGHHVGEPLLVTANDPATGLSNGDVAVLVDDGAGGLVAAVGTGAAPRLLALGRLPAVRPLHAMTVHRSQGSQFRAVTLVLPPAGSPLLTRETLYTAVTRAEGRVRVVGDAEALLAAVARPAARASGLRERLRG